MKSKIEELEKEIEKWINRNKDCPENWLFNCAVSRLKDDCFTCWGSDIKVFAKINRVKGLKEGIEIGEQNKLAEVEKMINESFRKHRTCMSEDLVGKRMCNTIKDLKKELKQKLQEMEKKNV